MQADVLPHAADAHRSLTRKGDMKMKVKRIAIQCSTIILVVAVYAITVLAASPITVPCVVNDKAGDLLSQMAPGGVQTKVVGEVQLARVVLKKVDIIGRTFELSEALPALSAGRHRRPNTPQASFSNHFISLWVNCRAPKKAKVIDFSSLRLKIGGKMIAPIGLGTGVPINKDSNFNSFEIGAAVLSVDGKLQPMADMNMGRGRLVILAGDFPENILLRFAFEVPKSTSDYVLVTSANKAVK
jgi:hypothetical protein